jgi:hypothetical protein
MKVRKRTCRRKAHRSNGGKKRTCRRKGHGGGCTTARCAQRGFY